MMDTDETRELERYFDRLWPLLRSITGDGVRATHDILTEVAPLERHEIPTGSEALDWIVPDEWRVREAYLVGPDGERVLDAHDNNLHLLNYSAPFTGTVSRAELDEHLFSLPDQPDAIPYRTSYYRRRWGFCLSHRQRVALPDGDYRVVIDTEHFAGSLTLSEAVLPGETDEEVLFTTYTCHPSLALNELSGPLLTAFLYRRIAAWPQRRLTYRFVFGPETIGSICYLAMRGEEMKRKLNAGYIVTCVGDDGDYRLKLSRRGASLADRAARHALQGLPHSVVDFGPSGSDERQYCSIGFNLPVASITRTAYGNYPGYHNSGDNKSLMDFDAMTRTLDLYERIARILDLNERVRNRVVHGEPQMSKYGELYPTVSQGYPGDQAMALKWLIQLADGETDLIAIAERSALDVELLADVASRLVDVGLFERLGPVDAV